MEKIIDTNNLTRVVERRLSQLKVTARLLAHEIEVSAGEKNMNMDQDLAQSILTTLELFIEDSERAKSTSSPSITRDADKPQVTRLN